MIIKTVGALRRALGQHPDSTKIMVSGLYGSTSEIEMLEKEEENRACGECGKERTDITVWIRTDLMTG